MKVEILQEEELFKGFFQLHRTRLRFEKFDGTMSEPVSRLNVFRADAVAILTYDSDTNEIIMVKQFRYPIYTVEPENGWTLEIVAGSIEKEMDAKMTAVREVEEEIGYRIRPDHLEYIGRCYPSPGGTCERIYLYAADVAQGYKANHGGGLDEESEDIQVLRYSTHEIRRMMLNGELYDAKTLNALYWYFTKRKDK